MSFGALAFGEGAFGADAEGGEFLTAEEIIEGALIAHAELMELDPPLPVAWPNRPFEPPTDGGAYLRVDHLRNENERLFVKGTNPHRRQGILQLNVFTPLKGGALASTRLAGIMAGHWHAGLKLYADGLRIEVEAAPTVHGAIPVDAMWQTPVSVRYRCFA